MDDRIKREFELLEGIQQRPGMYLWSPNEAFKALVNFLRGYWEGQCDEWMRSPYDDPLAPCGGEFHEWLLRIKQERGFVGDRNVGWPGLISSSFPTEEERFKAFFRLLAEYRCGAAEGK